MQAKLIFLIVFIPLALNACQHNTPSPDEVVRQAINRLPQSAHYVATGSSSASLSGEIIRYTIRYQAPDRYYVKMEDGPEAIVIGNQGWAYFEEEGWKPGNLPEPHPRQLALPIDPGVIVGAMYQGKSKSGFDIYFLGSERELTFFIEGATGLLRSLVLAGGDGITLHDYDYQTPVTINPPL